uniref:Protease n=1 Tax=Ruminococcus flavefaciens TaxID=1265 RepID=Q52750_RUMFL|nr:protease [Ruminococcus flavefaciens]
SWKTRHTWWGTKHPQRGWTRRTRRGVTTRIEASQGSRTSRGTKHGSTWTNHSSTRRTGSGSRTLTCRWRTTGRGTPCASQTPSGSSALTGLTSASDTVRPHPARRLHLLLRPAARPPPLAPQYLPYLHRARPIHRRLRTTPARGTSMRWTCTTSAATRPVSTTRWITRWARTCASPTETETSPSGSRSSATTSSGW